MADKLASLEVADKRAWLVEADTLVLLAVAGMPVLLPVAGMPVLLPGADTLARLAVDRQMLKAVGRLVPVRLPVADRQLYFAAGNCVQRLRAGKQERPRVVDTLLDQHSGTLRLRSLSDTLLLQCLDMLRLRQVSADTPLHPYNLWLP